MVAAPARARQDALSAASVYVSVFAGRDDAFAVWGGDHWVARREPLTPDVVVKAFTTGVPLSSYIVGTDQKVPLAALDIDRDDGKELGARFLRHLDDRGGVGYLEGSRRGCHVWIPLWEYRPAILVRRAMRALMKEAGLPDDPHIELRPGSDRVAEGGLGHCLRMPTMPHQRTGVRYAMYDIAGTQLPAKLTGLMLELDACPVSIIDEAAERAPLPPLTNQPRDLRYRFGEPEATESASQILITLWHADPRAAPGKLIRCPAHDDQHPSLSILRDDERAICRSPGCLLNNDDNGRGLWELRAMAPGRGS